jgi:AcrR family transcriptional regulator
VSPKSRKSNKPVFDAIVRGDAERLRALLAQGYSAQEPWPQDGDTPLGAATPRGNLEVIRALLEAGADPNEAHIPPIIDAANEKRLDIVEPLLEAGAGITVRGPYRETLLIAAVPMESAALLQRIIDAGVDVQARDSHGRTALPLQNGPRDKRRWRLRPQTFAIVRCSAEARSDTAERSSHPHWLSCARGRHLGSASCRRREPHSGAGGGAFRASGCLPIAVLKCSTVASR